MTENNGTPDILGNPLFQMAARRYELQRLARAQIAEILLSTKPWEDMSKKERELCIHYLANESATEEELHVRLADAGVTYPAVSWQEVDPTDKAGLEAQTLLKALGGMIAKNGALVMVNTIDDLIPDTHRPE